MKKGIVIFVIGVVCTFSFASSVSATLIERGNGMIYDDDLNITFANAKYGAGTWSNAVSWADSLVFGGYDDWRLPTADDTCVGYFCTGSIIA